MINMIIKKALVSEELNTLIDNMPKGVGSMGYDPWGYHSETLKPAIGVLKWFYDHYFRVETYGLENVPTNGRILIISNHSGQIPTDGMMIGVALATNPNGPRAPRAMVERFVFGVPFVGNFFAQIGSAVGDPVNCIRMLKREQAVIVFPEGVRGASKPYNKRYQLQKFGSGFMHMAMSTHTPIIPVGVAGCEETMPALLNIKPLAKILGLPSVPLTVPFPLPSKIIIHFGKPLEFFGEIENEDMIEDRVGEVKTAVRKLLALSLAKRKGGT